MAAGSVQRLLAAHQPSWACHGFFLQEMEKNWTQRQRRPSNKTPVLFALARLPSWILNWEERGRERLWLKSRCFLQHTETGCGDKSWESPLELQKGYAIIILSRTENVWVLIGLWWREGVNILHAQCSSSRTQWLHTRSAFHRMMPPMLGTFKHLSMNCNSLPSWT